MPDGGRLATASRDRTVPIWSSDSGAELDVLHGHADAVQAVAWSPTGKLLMSGSRDRTAGVWRAERRSGIIAVISRRAWIGTSMARVRWPSVFRQPVEFYENRTSGLLEVGREGVEPPKLARRFYRPLGSPHGLCRPTALGPSSGACRSQAGSATYGTQPGPGQGRAPPTMVSCRPGACCGLSSPPPTRSRRPSSPS